MSKPAVVVYIVRHGETEENAQAIIQGQKDTILNDAGREQARQVADALKDVSFDKAWCSDLRRAAETAEEITKHHPGLELIKQSTLRERYMGSWEGMTVKERHAQLRQGAKASGEESVADMSARVAQWWRENVDEYARTLTGPDGAGAEGGEGPRQVLVVSHGYFISLLLRGLVDSGAVEDVGKVAGGRIGNASVTRIWLGQDARGKLVSFGEISHLKGAQAWAGSKEAQ